MRFKMKTDILVRSLCLLLSIDATLKQQNPKHSENNFTGKLHHQEHRPLRLWGASICLSSQHMLQELPSSHLFLKDSLQPDISEVPVAVHREQQISKTSLQLKSHLIFLVFCVRFLAPCKRFNSAMAFSMTHHSVSEITLTRHLSLVRQEKALYQKAWQCRTTWESQQAAKAPKIYWTEFSPSLITPILI